MKYARDRPKSSLIRFNENPNGSPIWSKAAAGRSIVQKHSFWEIRSGNLAKFWDDAWNQLPILGRDPRWHPIKLQDQEWGRTLVNQVWHPEPLDELHRWNFPTKPEAMHEDDWAAFQDEMRNRCLRA